MNKKTRSGLTWMSNVVAVDAHLGEEQQQQQQNFDSGLYQLLNKDPTYHSPGNYPRSC